MKEFPRLFVCQVDQMVDSVVVLQPAILPTEIETFTLALRQLLRLSSFIGCIS